MADVLVPTNLIILPPEQAPGFRAHGADALESLRRNLNDTLITLIENVNEINIEYGISAIGAGFDGGASVLTAGIDVLQPVRYSATIVDVVVVGKPAGGSVVIDVSKCTFADYPTFVSIVAAAPPTITASDKSEDTTLTGWTREIVAGDIVRFTLTSVSVFTQVAIALKVLKGETA